MRTRNAMGGIIRGGRELVIPGRRGAATTASSWTNPSSRRTRSGCGSVVGDDEDKDVAAMVYLTITYSSLKKRTKYNLTRTLRAWRVKHFRFAYSSSRETRVPVYVVVVRSSSLFPSSSPPPRRPPSPLITQRTFPKSALPLMSNGIGARRARARSYMSSTDRRKTSTSTLSSSSSHPSRSASHP